MSKSVQPRGGDRAATSVALALVLTLSTCPGGAAAEDFYAGKTINIYIGTGEGPGAMTSYPRAIAQLNQLEPKIE
jgi:hypothetical protein